MPRVHSSRTASTCRERHFRKQAIFPIHLEILLMPLPRDLATRWIYFLVALIAAVANDSVINGFVRRFYEYHFHTDAFWLTRKQVQESYKKSGPDVRLSLIISEVKTRKWHLWREFGYSVLISIHFDDFTSPFTPYILFLLRRYIKHSRQCFSWAIQAPRISSKMLRSASYFQHSLPGVLWLLSRSKTKEKNNSKEFRMTESTAQRLMATN